MTGTMKKGVGLLVLVFIFYYMYQDPHGLALMTKEGASKIWDLLHLVFTGLFSFLHTLTSSSS